MKFSICLAAAIAAGLVLSACERKPKAGPTPPAKVEAPAPAKAEAPKAEAPKAEAQPAPPPAASPEAPKT